MKTKLKKALKNKQRQDNQKSQQIQTGPPDKEQVLLGRRVVVQTRRGHIIEGVYHGIVRGEIYLTNAEVIGIHRRVKVSCVYIPLTNYGHMHPEPLSIENGGQAEAKFQ